MKKCNATWEVQTQMLQLHEWLLWLGMSRAQLGAPHSTFYHYLCLFQVLVVHTFHEWIVDSGARNHMTRDR